LDLEGAPRPNSRSFLRLNRNESFFEPAPEVESLLAHGDVRLARRYAPELLDQQLRSELSLLLGVEKIALFHGAEDALLKCLLLWKSDHSTVVLPELSWSNYRSLAQGLGYATEEFSIETSSRGFEHNWPQLEMLLRNSQKSKIVILASPNNPTGHSFSIARIESLAQKFPSHTFLVDGVYDVFPSPFAKIASSFANVSFVGSFSKFFGMPGLRLGYACGSFPSAFHLALGFNPHALEIAAAALRAKEHYIRNWASMQSGAENLCEKANRGIPPSKMRVYLTQASFLLIEFLSDDFSFEDAQERAQILPKCFEFQKRKFVRFGLGPSWVFERIECYLGMDG
jgi:histidinol-phosphate aminotransferase